MISLTLPFPPSVNRMYRAVHGHVLIAAEGRRYRRTVAMEVLVQLAQTPRKTLTERLAVKILFVSPDKRRRDADNLLKALLDALTHAGVWLDDSQIDDLHIVRGPVVQNAGYVQVSITEL